MHEMIGRNMYSHVCKYVCMFVCVVCVYVYIQWRIVGQRIGGHGVEK